MKQITKFKRLPFRCAERGNDGKCRPYRFSLCR